MGKSKKRILAKGARKQLSSLSREDAIKYVLSCDSFTDAQHVMTLFGLKPDELLEAGMSYEQIKRLEGPF